MSPEHVTAAVDLGKTQCRVAVMTHERRIVQEGAGSPGLATADGVATAMAAIVPLLSQFDHPISDLSVGAAGAWAAPDAARQLARALAEHTGARVAVASDVVTAHVGALEGETGVLLIAGTGAAALGVDLRGVRLIDGWGPELGDLGSGSWLGREAVRAVLRAATGLGPETRLTAAVAAHTAPATDPVSWLASDIPTARQLATLAPLVLDLAEAGDPVAAQISAEAIRLLTASARAASADFRVTTHGGLTSHAWFKASLELALLAAGGVLVPANGDAIAGAFLIARRSDLPHERFVHRAE